MKLGFIGTGKIVVDALFAVQPLKNIERNAIFARPRSKEKAEKLAAENGIKEVYTDYAELLAKADVDTVYIGLINSVHYEYAKQALTAGKSVILEKPFTGTYAEAEDLVKTAEANDVFVFEAITVLHNPVHRKMVEDLPKLGPIRAILANYSQYSSRYDEYLAGNIGHAFDKEFLGGALRDINVYNLHHTISLFGAPKNAVYYPNLGPNGIDTSGTAFLQYDGFAASCTGAKDSDSPGYICVQGEKGWMRIDGKPNVCENLTTVYVDENNHEIVRDSAGANVRATIREEFVPEPVHHRMTEEFNDFATIIDNHDRKAAEQYVQETLAVMKVVDSLVN